MSNLENAKLSVKKILDCNTLIDCQNNLQDILNDVGFHDQPSDLVDNDDYIQLINYIDDLMKISTSGPSTDTIDELTNLLQDTKTDIYTYLDNFVYDDTSHETIEDYIAADFKDFQDFFLDLVKGYLYNNIEEYLNRI
tara:strand:- start:293 stop:706 length:414 start_codon:yes stop_codon:yes gene_type:complete